MHVKYVTAENVIKFKQDFNFTSDYKSDSGFVIIQDFGKSHGPWQIRFLPAQMCQCNIIDVCKTQNPWLLLLKCTWEITLLALRRSVKTPSNVNDSCRRNVIDRNVRLQCIIESEDFNLLAAGGVWHSHSLELSTTEGITAAPWGWSRQKRKACKPGSSSSSNYGYKSSPVNQLYPQTSSLPLDNSAPFSEHSTCRRKQILPLFHHQTHLVLRNSCWELENVESFDVTYFWVC